MLLSNLNSRGYKTCMPLSETLAGTRCSRNVSGNYYAYYCNRAFGLEVQAKSGLNIHINHIKSLFPRENKIFTTPACIKSLLPNQP